MQTWECAVVGNMLPTHIRSASHTTLMSGTGILPADFRFFLEWYMNDKCLCYTSPILSSLKDTSDETRAAGVVEPQVSHSHGKLSRALKIFSRTEWACVIIK